MKSIFRRLVGKYSRVTTADHNADQAKPASQVEMEILEPRMLFSAAPVETPAETEDAEEPQAAEESVAVSPSAAQDAPAAVSKPESTQEGLAAGATLLGQSEVSGNLGVNLVNLNPGVEEVHRETLEAIAEAAAERWRATGLTSEQSAALDGIEYVVEDLGGTHLGFAEGNRITLDDNAAGSLWFIDPTPLADEEYTAVGESGTLFSANSGTFAWGKTDLLTVIMHEQGNLLGLDDVESGTGNLMLGTLGYNNRVLPAFGQAEGATPGAIDESFLDSGVTGAGQAFDNMQSSVAVNYIVNVSGGTFPSPSGAGDTFLGEVRQFAGTFAPGGWLFADGQLLSISSNTALFSLLGTTYGGDGTSTFALPDLRGRVPIHEGAGFALGASVGTNEVTLIEAQLAAHTHSTTGANTGSAGAGQAFDNMQSSVALNYIVNVSGGTYPSPSGAGDTFLGEIRQFAGTFAPGGWLFADGQLLSISSNTALFSLLGTTYGGDGTSTFALPDLRGRAAIHEGAGFALGASVGTEDITLTEAQLAAHSHTLPGGSSGSTGGGQAFDNMQPSVAVNHIVNVSGGTYPSPSGAGDTFLGEIRQFAGTFAPGGWLFADGQLLSISSNTALFSLLGTTYGGDGTSTFALPDLRGRTAIHEGVGFSLGASVGTNEVTLTEAQLAAHSHELPVPADTTAPTVTSIVRQNPTNEITNADQVTFRVTFDEDVQNVDVADFTLSGTAAGDGTIGAPSAVTGSSVFDVTVTGLTSSNGTINLDFAGGQNIQDLAGNALANTTPGSEEDYTLDNTGPTPNITGPASPTNGDPFNVTIDFSETVSNFVQGDVTVTGGSVSSFTDNGSGNYTVGIDATADGAVSVSVAASVATDAAGNNNSASNTFNVTVDTTGPTPAITGPASPTNSDPFNVTIDFGETVNDFVQGDVTVTGGSVSSFTDNGSGNYTVGIDATADGAVSVSVAANVATDAAGNNNSASNTFNVAVDTEGPTPTITGPAGPLTNLDPFDVTIDFGEAVSGFLQSEVTVGNGSVTGFTDNTGGNFTVQITPAAAGNVTVDVGAGAAIDDAGNGNTAAAQFSVTIVLAPAGDNSASVSGTDLTINADGDGDTVTITSDGTTLRISTPDDSILGGNGTTTHATGDVFVPIAGLTSITLNTGDDDDTINITSLDGFTGALTIDGGDGQDFINFRADVTLADGNDAALTAEEISFVGGGIETGGDGTITLDGTGGSGGTFKGVSLNNSNLTTDTGAIDIDGQGGDTGNNNQGVIITGTSSVTTGGGDISIDGTGGGDASGHGVYLHTGSSVSAGGSGALIITGAGSATGTTKNSGVYGVRTNLTVADGPLTIVGTGHGSTGYNKGVDLNTAVLTGTGGGNISVTGSSDGSSKNNQGISMLNTTVTTAATGSGSITLDGTGSSSGLSLNEGVRLSNTDLATGGNGFIDIDGLGGGTGSGATNGGVSLLTGSTAAAAGSGTLTIDGTGGSGTSNNRGVYVTGAGSSLSTVNGNLTIRGHGNGSTSYNRGVELVYTTVSSTGSGAVTLEGTGSQTSSGNQNTGVSLKTSDVSATVGGITLTGNGGTGNRLNEGVYMSGGSLSGALSLTGTASGSTTGNSNTGVSILNANLGGVTGGSITGTGGGSMGNYNHGIYMQGIVGGFGGTTLGTAGFGAQSLPTKGNFPFV